MNMEKADARKEIHGIIDQLPDDSLHTVKDMLNSLLVYLEKHQFNVKGDRETKKADDPI